VNNRPNGRLEVTHFDTVSRWNPDRSSGHSHRLSQRANRRPGDDAPIGFGGIAPRTSNQYLRDPDWYQATGAPVASDGTLPFYRYVIREKGKVEIGQRRQEMQRW
jgi:hypothetical protein